MKKIIIACLFSLFSFVSIYAAKTDIILSYSKADDFTKYTKGISQQIELKSDRIEKLRTALDYKLLDTEKGVSVVTNGSIHYDYSNKVDFWIGGTYRHDEIVNIEPRTDWKLGFGYYLTKDKKDVLKLSYGLISRDNDLLHSFRIKHKIEKTFLDIGYGCKTIVYYILPISNKLEKELRMTVNPYVKLISLKPGVVLEYVKTETSNYFGFAFNLGLEF